MNVYTEPHYERAALLTIDMQRDFTLPDAPAAVPGTSDVAPAVAKLVSAFRAAQQPIFHVVRLYLRDGSNVDLCRRAAIEAGESIVAPDSDGAELVDELKPNAEARLDADRLLSGHAQALGEQEKAVYKPRWGAFYGTLLEDELRNAGIDTVVICGCNFPNCPRTTVYEASERDFRVVLAADATSGLYNRGANELRNIGVAVEPTEALIGRVAG